MNDVIQVGVTKYTEWNKQQYRVYSTEGIAPCLNCCGGGGLEPKIVVYDERDIWAIEEQGQARQGSQAKP